MNSCFRFSLFCTVLVLLAAKAHAIGFQKIIVDDPGQPDLTVGVWYPTDTDASEHPNTEFGQAVALNAPIKGVNGGLILLSHGFGGWYASHAGLAKGLADAGYLVAAPSHTGNTGSDMSSSIDQWALDRPRHISRTLDGMLAHTDFRNHFDVNKVGMYGFSAGGFTAMSLLGAVPDFELAKQHCNQTPSEYVCAEGAVDGLLAASVDELPHTAWGADTRIKAAAIAAPGFGFSYSRESLSNISARVQLWSGELDDTVPTSSNAKRIANLMSKQPEIHQVESAGHYAFLHIACSESFERHEPDEFNLICRDVEGFDRQEFHRTMQIEILRFFKSSMLDE